MQSTNTHKGPVLLFDGVCNLCTSSVHFIIKRDPKRKFRFASLQSAFGQNVLQEHQLNTQTFDSLVLLENGKIYQRSTAALRIARQLSGAWPLLYIFMIVPAFIRNAVYDFIARNRYKWFGKKETCWLPTPDLQALFYN
jgi:predicted DCC family thiol-disulfide oxidoreductase YuxK